MDQRGPAASRADPISRHSGKERAEEELHAEAEPLLIERHGQRKSPPASNNRKREALEPTIKLHEAWDKPDQAAGWRATSETESYPARAEVVHETNVP